MKLNNSELIDFYKIFFRIRKTEEKISKEYHLGEIRCPVHLSIGQETVSVAFSMTQQLSDIAISTHRAHAHYLAKGGNLNKMIAEIYGKVTGCSRGRGGSMHLVDKDVGFIGSSAIVGNSIPVGIGYSLAKKINNDNSITYIFLGDGAIEEGSFYESINFAVLKNLKVIFVCENNLYSVYTRLSERQPSSRKISDLVQGLGVFTYTGDGSNPEQCLNLFKNAREKCLKTSEPQFIEFETYRWLEHCGPNNDDSLSYRPNSELEFWMNKDQLALLRSAILEQKLLSLGKLIDIEEFIESEIEFAFSQARKDPYPPIEEILNSQYAT
jgi:TPP-dependent pyruvate/acetoin dehydrogenase alpha subunit